MSFDIHVARRIGGLDIRFAFQRPTGILGLFGPSGSGKSSILNMVAGLLRPDAGHVIVGGRTLFDAATHIDLPTTQRRCGYIFQDLRLFPHMTVHANLRYGARSHHGSADDIVPGMDDVIALLGIGHLMQRRPASLSGGEAQRVAIGRALLMKPRFFLMDEPLTGLDQARRKDILDLIMQMHAATAIPILYVSHDQHELTYLTSDILHMPDFRL